MEYPKKTRDPAALKFLEIREFFLLIVTFCKKYCKSIRYFCKENKEKA